MRRVFPTAVLAFLVLLALPIAPALATDDDMPGTPLAVGGSVSERVESEDPIDVFSVDLVAGQEVYIRFDPGNVVGPKGNVHLFVPGASSIADAELYSEMNIEARGGVPYVSKHGAYFHYIPPRSGTYHLCAEWIAGILDYKLSVTRTSRAALNLVADADDLPGTAIGPGTVTGVVSTRGDLNDVYAISLSAGRPVSIQLAPLTPFENSWPWTARVSLLDSGIGAIAQSAGHVLTGPAEAVHAPTDADNRTGTIQYTPTKSGTYYLLVQSGPFVDPGAEGGMDFPYLLTITGSGVSPGSDSGFPDVSGSPYLAAILDLSGRGIISGYEDGTFRPTNPVTRQQFAKMIVKTLGLTVTGTEISPFTDVPVQSGSDPFYPSKYVAVCALQGITAGKTATTFAPADNITRQQLITMVARAASLPDPPADYAPVFTAGQFSAGEHYLNARKAAHAGLLDGLQGIGSSYGFAAASTRGECAQLLLNLLQQ